MSARKPAEVRIGNFVVRRGARVPRTPARRIAERYSYRVFWSLENEAYLGLCAEFPTLSYAAPHSLADALAGIIGTITDAVAALLRDGHDVPDPIAGGTHRSPE